MDGWYLVCIPCHLPLLNTSGSLVPSRHGLGLTCRVTAVLGGLFRMHGTYPQLSRLANALSTPYYFGHLFWLPHVYLPATCIPSLVCFQHTAQAIGHRHPKLPPYMRATRAQTRYILPPGHHTLPCSDESVCIRNNATGGYWCRFSGRGSHVPGLHPVDFSNTH
jgi:hypothetical protein